MSNNISQDRPFVRSVAITAALGEQRFRHCRLSMMVFLLALVFIAIGQKARAFQIPDFEKLVNEHGKAVVKVTVIGRTSPSGFDNQLPDLPPQFRYFFENLPHQQQPQPQPRSGFGSGFIISDDGYIVTNAHVVDNAEEVRIQLPDRSEYQAEIIGSDERSDIAVLKIDAEGLPTVTIGNSDDVNVGAGDRFAIRVRIYGNTRHRLCRLT